MALSVLTIQVGEDSHSLYCSKQKKIIMSGGKEELFGIKHILEEMEQQLENEKHFRKLKKKYMDIMTSSGNSRRTSEEFLKKQMPFLFTKQTA